MWPAVWHLPFRGHKENDREIQQFASKDMSDYKYECPMKNALLSDIYPKGKKNIFSDLKSVKEQFDCKISSLFREKNI